MIGGGFGGLAAAHALRREPVEITVLDRRNHHLFQPLLYQVASAALNPSDIAAPIRGILRGQENATVLLDEALAIDAHRHCVVLADRELEYDGLLLAAGAADTYFGHPEWERYAPGLKSLGDAIEIRNRVLYAFEAAERDAGTDAVEAWLTFVVIGGGPTGVELAGAIAEIAFHTLTRDFRRIDPRRARVILVEGGDRVLPTFTEESSASARRQLEKLGVVVRTGGMVTAMDAESVSIGGERIEARTKLWAAGVRASPLTKSLGVPLDRAGRVCVAPDLSIPGFPDVFACGDLCAIEQDGAPVPGVAPAAMQQGRHAAANLLRRIRGEETVPFRYVDKGSLATIGRRSAVAEIGKVRLSGWIAWLAWLGIHVVFLLGFRNRLMVLIQWAWAYVTFQRGARLITGSIPGSGESSEARGDS